jgi:thiol-disulfide isomerase/thioredoxin
LFFGDQGEEFFVTPDHTVIIGLEINRIKFSPIENQLSYITRPKVIFMGQDALFNTGFTDFGFRLRRMLYLSHNDANLEKLDPAAYQKYRLAQMNQMQDTLSNYCQLHQPGTKFRQYFQRYIKFRAANELLRYGWLNGRKKLLPDYFDFLSSIDFNDELGILTNEYRNTIYELSVLPYDGVVAIHSPDIEEVIKFAKENGYKFTSEQEQVVKNNVRFKDKGPDTLAYGSPNDSKADSIASSISEALFSGGRKSVDFQKEKNRQELFKRIKFNNTVSADILEARVAYNTINDKKGVDAAAIKNYGKTIKNPGLFNELLLENEDFQSKSKGIFSSQTHVINQLGQPQGHLIETLAERFKGKVIYVDFWAPWCGPCMGEMPDSKTLRKELEGKDVVFLFLGVECTAESWSKTIKTSGIEGEHYLLSKDEYSLLGSRFQIVGIPRYMLINKEGKIIDDNAKRPSDKMGLISQINLLLN